MATPPLAVVSGEGVYRAGGDGLADLGDGVAAPAVKAGEGAIDPSVLPPHAP